MLAAVMLLFGCKHPENDIVRIGVILPQTGFGALAAQQCKEGIDLAIDSLKKEGIQYEVLYEDCQSKVPNAVAAYRKLEAMGVRHIIVDGGQYTLGVAPITKGKDVIMMAVSTPNPNAVDLTDRIIRVSPLAKATVNILAHFAADSLKAQRGAVVYINNDAYRLYNKLFCEQFTELGGEIVSSEGCPTDARDFKAVVTKLGELEPDFVFVAAIGEQVGLITNQIIQNPKLSGRPILGNMNMGDPTVRQSINAEGQFIRYADVQMAPFFDGLYKDYHKTEPNSLSAQSYSALMILHRAISQKKTINEQLEYIKGNTFHTAILPLSFGENGECNIRMTMYAL